MSAQMFGPNGVPLSNLHMEMMHAQFSRVKRGEDEFKGICLGEEMGKDPSCRCYLMVLAGSDFAEGEGPHLVKVHHNAFRLDARTRDSYESTDLKRERRKIEESLLFGDDVTFLRKDYKNGYVNKFVSRGFKNMLLFERRGDMEIRIDGVMNEASTGMIWSRYFSFVPIGILDAGSMIANVALYFWVQLQPDFVTNTVTARFIEFDSVSPDNQGLVDEAPWNANDCTLTLDDSSDSDDDTRFMAQECVQKQKGGLSTSTLKTNLRCICTGYHSMYSDKLKEKKIVVPLLRKEQELQPGHTYTADLFYSKKHDCFMTYACIRKDPSRNPDVVVYPAKVFNLKNKCGLQITAKEVEGFPGIFESPDFGLIDDPDNLLAFHHLSQYSNQACKMFVYDGGPSKFGRFRVIEIDQEKKLKIDKAMFAHKMDLPRQQGIVMNEAGDRVFTLKHANIHFRFNPSTVKDWRLLDVGTRIKFTAQFNGNPGQFDVTEWSEVSPKPVPYVKRNNGEIWFHVDTIPDRQFPNCVKSKEFGVHDDPNDQLPMKFVPNKTYPLWVTPSLGRSTTSSSGAHTLFYVVHTGKEAPVDKEDVKPSFKESPVSSAPISRFAGPKMPSSTEAPEAPPPSRADSDTEGFSRFSRPKQSPQVPNGFTSQAESDTGFGHGDQSSASSVASSRAPSSRFSVPTFRNKTQERVPKQEFQPSPPPPRQMSAIEKMGPVKVELDDLQAKLKNLSAPIPQPPMSVASGPAVSRGKSTKAKADQTGVFSVTEIEEAVTRMEKDQCCGKTVNSRCSPSCPSQMLVRQAFNDAANRGYLENEHEELYDRCLAIVTA